MTFDELTLVTAIRRLDAGAADLITGQQRLQFALQVQEIYCRHSGDTRFPFSVDDVIGAYMKLRKNVDTRIKADIAIAHGATCFWRNRGKGECSEDAEAGHLVARTNGGELTVANAMIECRKHNNERREKSIDEYLGS